MKKFNSKSAKRELDTLFSRIILERDKVCQKCLKTKATQSAHIFSRNHLSTRWLPENAIGLCYYCHIFWGHRNPAEFIVWVIEKIGKRKFNWLNKKRMEKITFDEKFYQKTKLNLIKFFSKNDK